MVCIVLLCNSRFYIQFMHSLFNPVQKRLATLEADSAPVANPEPRLFSRLVVVIIIMIIANGCHAFTRAWAAMRSSTKIKKKQEIRPPDSRVCLYVCMYGIFQRENARLSLAGPERSGPAGRSVVIITALFYFIIFFFICSQTARQLVFHFLMFFFLLLFLFPVTSVLLLLVSVEVRGRMRV